MSSYRSMSTSRDGDAYVTARETREAAIRVAVGFAVSDQARDGDLKTGIAFFDHMLEMLGWWADVTIDASYQHRTFPLHHVVTEDIGLALGATLAEVIRDRLDAGVESSGAARAGMDESQAEAFVSFEGRSNVFVRRGGAATLERVEDMNAVDLVAFFEGFCQGARATVQLDLEHGADPHHAWEAGFRAFGRALRAALAANPRRAGRTAGVKGTLD